MLDGREKTCWPHGSGLKVLAAPVSSIVFFEFLWVCFLTCVSRVLELASLCIPRNGHGAPTTSPSPSINLRELIPAYSSSTHSSYHALAEAGTVRDSGSAAPNTTASSAADTDARRLLAAPPKLRQTVLPFGSQASCPKVSVTDNEPGGTYFTQICQL